MPVLTLTPPAALPGSAAATRTASTTRRDKVGRVVSRPMDERPPKRAHTERPWRIPALAHDFRLEDVWALPTPGGPDDFPLLLEAFAEGDLGQGSSRLAGLLFAARLKVGALLGWDRQEDGVGGR